jgi:nucleotide-binding universal stress UspA family protein
MNVLVAVDDSADSEACLREVATRPWPNDTQVRVLSVTHTLAAAPLPAGGLLPMENEFTEAARRVAEHGMEVLRAGGLNARLRVRHGGVGSEIVEEAREWPADLVVVGTHDRSALQRTLRGSVADYVVHHAPCSVEVVRARQRTSVSNPGR